MKGSTKDAVRHAKKKAVRHPRPDGYPKRPLTAFNIFFRCQRVKLIGQGCDKNDECLTTIELKEQIAVAAASGTKCGTKRPHRKTHGKISFGDLGKIISSRWKNIEPKIKEVYDEQASRESKRYKIAVNKFNETMGKRAAKKEDADDGTRLESAPDGLNSMLHVDQLKQPHIDKGLYYSSGCSSIYSCAGRESMRITPSSIANNSFPPSSLNALSAAITNEMGQMKPIFFPSRRYFNPIVEHGRSLPKHIVTRNNDAIYPMIDAENRINCGLDGSTMISKYITSDESMCTDAITPSDRRQCENYQAKENFQSTAQDRASNSSLRNDISSLYALNMRKLHTDRNTHLQGFIHEPQAALKVDLFRANTMAQLSTSLLEQYKDLTQLAKRHQASNIDAQSRNLANIIQNLSKNAYQEQRKC